MSRVTGLPGVLIGMVAVFACGAGVARGGVISFVNDYEGWLEAAGGVAQEIDFETLPDGSPSQTGTPITEDFNYTGQGVTFSRTPPEVEGFLFIGGNPIGGFDLGVEAVAIGAGIISDLVEPAYASGVFFGGFSTFSIFDAQGNLLGEESAGGHPGDEFVGFVSDEPIEFTLNTDGGTAEVINSYLFVPVPEPGTVVLLGLASGALCCPRRLRKEASYPHIRR